MIVVALERTGRRSPVLVPPHQVESLSEALDQTPSDQAGVTRLVMRSGAEHLVMGNVDAIARRLGMDIVETLERRENEQLATPTLRVERHLRRSWYRLTRYADPDEAGPAITNVAAEIAADLVGQG